MNVIERLEKRSKHFAHVKRHWLTIAFVGGFIVDNLTLNRVDQFYDQAILFLQITLAITTTIVVYAAIAEKFPERWCPPIRKYAPLVTQYAFGGLLSGTLIFYGRSGVWTDSWPFLLVVVGVIYLNETIKDRTSRLAFNLGTLFIVLFSYVVLVVPVVLGFMGPLVFVGSGLLALGIMSGVVRILFWIIPRFMALHKRMIIFMIGTIFVCFNFLYFTNIIPPIPLSLKDVGIYHSVVHFDDGSYELKYEDGPWWQFWKSSDTVFHPGDGGSVFCFAKVFAPTRLSTEIYHRWQYYDKEAGRWKDHARLSYSISGGRSAGYRGYTLVNTPRDGEWRCVVETERGQVLGRETFTVDSSEKPDDIVTRKD